MRVVSLVYFILWFQSRADMVCLRLVVYFTCNPVTSGLYAFLVQNGVDVYFNAIVSP